MTICPFRINCQQIFSYKQLSSQNCYVSHINNRNDCCKSFPKWNAISNLFIKSCAVAQIRSKYQHTYSKEEQFFHFRNKFPEFIQPVPQYLLASYLGFTPEYEARSIKKLFLKPVQVFTSCHHILLFKQNQYVRWKKD